VKRFFAWRPSALIVLDAICRWMKWFRGAYAHSILILLQIREVCVEKTELNVRVQNIQEKGLVSVDTNISPFSCWFWKNCLCCLWISSSLLNDLEYIYHQSWTPYDIGPKTPWDHIDPYHVVFVAPFGSVIISRLLSNHLETVPQNVVNQYVWSSSKHICVT
jgi:hypothetical protein